MIPLTGNELIDKQHLHLESLVPTVIDDDSFKVFIEAAEEHFFLEEGYIHLFQDYEHRREHLSEHHRLLQDLRTQNGNITQEYLAEWLVDHINEYDIPLVNLIKLHFPDLN